MADAESMTPAESVAPPAAKPAAVPVPKPAAAVPVPKPGAAVPVKPVAAGAPARPVAAGGGGHKAEEKGAGPTPGELAELTAAMTRREFLNYAFLASLGIFTLGLGGVTFYFALPRFKAGEFGGIFALGTAAEVIPPTTAGPKPDAKAKIWLSNSDKGVIALYNVCVHLGCLYQWIPSNNRFECPCHGSKYQKDGTYIEGPAPRSLDRMIIIFQDGSGKEIARTDATGAPIQIPSPDATIVIDTGKIILGKPHG